MRRIIPTKNVIGPLILSPKIKTSLRYTWWFGCLSSYSQAEDFLHAFTVPLFATELRLETKDKRFAAQSEKMIYALKKKGNYFLDPDCRWRKATRNGCENPDKAETKIVEEIAHTFERETQGIFSVYRGKSGSVKRDFAGLSQGFILQEIINAHPKAQFLADFSGDIFLSPGYRPSQGLFIGDPLLPRIKFAQVFLAEGWMVTSSARKLGADMYHPNQSAGKWVEDFLQIVIFAKPEFNGARADAWATALIVGGKKLLKNLWSQPSFSGQWGYFYFSNDGSPFCSENLECSLGSTNRFIKVKW